MANHWETTVPNFILLRPKHFRFQLFPPLLVITVEALILPLIAVDPPLTLVILITGHLLLIAPTGLTHGPLIIVAVKPPLVDLVVVLKFLDFRVVHLVAKFARLGPAIHQSFTR